MDLINPYAVMRDTATFEAYKAYGRKAARAGQLFFIGGFLSGILVPELFIFGGRWLLHKSPLDWRWALIAVVVAEAAGLGLLAIGIMRVLRFRRDNPVPDEWRQIPRIRTPLVAGRRPRLPSQG